MSKLALLNAAFLAGSIAAGSPALADDGRIVITQAKALAGGVTPGDNRGFPITITRSGTYVLDSNLDVSPGSNGIVVAADFVTIDLNGFSMHGNQTALNGVTTSDSYRVGLVLQNGAIWEFKNKGIFASGASSGAIQNMSVLGNGKGGIDVKGLTRISDSQVSANLGTGITCLASCLIERNIIYGNVGPGVFTYQGTILGNTIELNQGLGIRGYETGAGNNSLIHNSGSVTGVFAMQPNACVPECTYGTDATP